MTSWPRILLWTSCLALAGAALTGCAKDGDKPMLTQLKEKLLVSPKSARPEAILAQDADQRREWVEYHGDKWHGHREPYLKTYATLLKTDEDPLVRSAAVRALGKAKAMDYIVVVIKALDDEEASVRWDAAVALGNMPDRQAIDPLRRHALDDDAKDVRLASVKALRPYSPKRVAPTLVRCLSDPDFSVRYHAHRALVAMTGTDYGTNPDAWPIAKLPERAAPAAEDKTPWWDWAGVTGKEEPSPAKPAAAGSTGSGGPANDKKTPGRPWWDWGGVTDKDKPSPAKASTPTAPDTPKKEASARPWWDLAGVTAGGAKPEPVAPQAGPPAGGAEAGPAPAKAERPSSKPWWDWMGVTEGDKAQDTKPAPDAP